MGNGIGKFDDCIVMHFVIFHECPLLAPVTGCSMNLLIDEGDPWFALHQRIPRMKAGLGVLRVDVFMPHLYQLFTLCM